MHDHCAICILDNTHQGLSLGLAAAIPQRAVVARCLWGSSTLCPGHNPSWHRLRIDGTCVSPIWHGKVNGDTKYPYPAGGSCDSQSEAQKAAFLVEQAARVSTLKTRHRGPVLQGDARVDESCCMPYSLSSACTPRAWVAPPSTPPCLFGRWCRCNRSWLGPEVAFVQPQHTSPPPNPLPSPPSPRISAAYFVVMSQYIRLS